MSNRYTLQEPLFRSNSKYPFLSLDRNQNSILGILRLISGTTNCYDSYLGKTTKIRTNFIELPFSRNERLNQDIIQDLFPDEVELKDLNQLFRRARQNMSFYQHIEYDLIKCLLANNDNRHLESFFFLYRILEGICYTIPLIYTSKATDYKRSYLSLKSFFSENKDGGERAFFRKYITEVYKDEDFFRSTLDINVNVIDVEEIREGYFDIYKDKVDDRYLADFTEKEELKVKFIGYYGFMIEIRNRYFHFLQGTHHSNLSSEEVQYPNLFFKPVIDNGINWVSIILFEIIKYDLMNGNN